MNSMQNCIKAAKQIIKYEDVIMKYYLNGFITYQL